MPLTVDLALGVAISKSRHDLPVDQPRSQGPPNLLSLGGAREPHHDPVTCILLTTVRYPPYNLYGQGGGLGWVRAGYIAYGWQHTVVNAGLVLHVAWFGLQSYEERRQIGHV